MTEAEILVETFNSQTLDAQGIARRERVRQACKYTAKVLLEECPLSADLTVALRKLHEAMMTANKAIACEKLRKQ
jgi:hypothetical protein